MRGLQTARAVVIDENPHEAIPLIEALSVVGVGAVYVRGDDPKALPQTPLEGIRVVFLDLKLIVGTEPRHYIPHAVNVLTRVVSIDPGTTGIICWSKQGEEGYQEFLKQCESQGIKAAFIEAVESKVSYIPETSGAPLDSNAVNGILKEINGLLQKHPARRVLMNWEQDLHDAGSRVSWRLLSGISTGAGSEDTAMKRLAAVSRAASEEPIESPETAAEALARGLAPLHLDEVESRDPTALPQHTSLLASISALATSPLSGLDRAGLNSSLLCSSVAQGSKPRPGSIYLDKGWNIDGGFPAKLSDKELKRFIMELFPKRRSPKEENADYTKRIESLLAGGQGCLVEITPACDAASKDGFRPRLLHGVLLPWPGADDKEPGYSLPAESRLHARDLEFILFDVQALGLKGAFKLIASARRLSYVPYEQLKKCDPVARIRHPVLADMRAWFATHAARPGYASVR